MQTKEITESLNEIHFISNLSLDKIHDLINVHGSLVILETLEDKFCLYQFTSSSIHFKLQYEIYKLTDASLLNAVKAEQEALVKQILACSKLAFSSCYYYSELIHEAIKQGNLPIFIELISNDHFYQDLHPSLAHYSIVEAAIEHNRLDMIEELFTKNLQFNPSKSMQLLGTAAARGHIGIMNLLLGDYRINVGSALKEAIRRAAGNNQCAALYILLANDRATIQDWYNALSSAISNGHLELVNAILQREGMDPSMDNDYLLFQAVHSGQFKMVARLLQDKRVNPFSIQCNRDGTTAVSLAAYKGDLNSLELFLKDPRISPEDYLKALSSAISGKHGHLAMFFLKHCNVKRDTNFNQLFCSAVYNGLTEVVELLLTYPEVDPSFINDSALCTASSNGSLPILRMLLNDKRVNPNARIEAYRCQSPLRKAVSQGHLDVVKHFIEIVKIDLTLYPELIAVICQQHPKNNDLEMVKYLVQDGRVNLHYNYDDAIEGAARWNKRELLNYLLDVWDIYSPTNMTKGISSAIKAGYYETTEILLKRCEIIIVEMIIEQLPKLLKSCHEKNLIGPCIFEQEEKYLKILTLVVADPRISKSKSLKEWDEFLDTYSFRHETQRETVRLAIIKSLSQETWKKARFFALPRDDQENELPSEVKDKIYISMLS